MSDTKNKFYLTTPIYYVNARPHIGHAYTTIAADVIARRHRLLGDDTFFLTGTDEHGQKIERSAAAAGIPPQQFADEVSASFRALWQRMGITNDAYIRTTDAHHKQGVQKLFSLLQKNGFIELRTYTGQYSIGEEMFVDGPPGTIGPDGKPTETVSEENYFFKLSEFQRPLIDLIESNELLIQPESRRNEVLSFLRGDFKPYIDKYKQQNLSTSTVERNEADLNVPAGDDLLGAFNLDGIERSAKGNPYVPGALKDLSISRSSFKWGIPVPGDEKHVIYVWLDALANYMTAIGYGSEDPEEKKKFEKYWPADLHLVGKEIIRFHCVYWPAFLLALNPAIAGKNLDEVPMEIHTEWAKKMLPKAITAHGWLLFEDSKMSKSRGNIVRTETILDAFGTLLPNPAEADSLIKSAASTNPKETEANSLVKGTASAVPQHPSEGAALAAEVRLPSAGEWKHEQDLFSADVLRYFLLREIPFGQDGSFSFDALVQRYNSDLVNGYGNLVSRTVSMVDKYFEGVVPDPQRLNLHDLARTRISFHSYLIEQRRSERKYSEESEDFDSLAKSAYRDDITNFSSFLQTLARLITLTDQFITEEAPWKAREGENEDARKSRLAVTLYSAIEDIRLITAILYPVIPFSTSKVWSVLSIKEPLETYPLSERWWGEAPSGTKLGPLSPIFPRAPKELIQLMNDIEQNSAQNNATQKPAKAVGLPHINNNSDATTHPRTEFLESPISSASATASLNPIAETLHPITPHHPEEPGRPDTPQIAIDDFVKIDLRVAQIVVAERIPKADKLLRLEVDLGYERRQILSGIAQWYTPEELIGRKIVVIANLAPRKMRGLESHGMLLAASHGEDGKPVLATFAEDIALGSRLK
jgi:methionyl-tRNA synthetase